MTCQLIDEYFGHLREDKLSNPEKTYQYPTLNHKRIFELDESDYLSEW
jgi:hypothetical protein